jgi:hypothetical protein
MGWPITKEELMQQIDELLIENENEIIRPEVKERNKVLISAYLEDLKKYMGNGE